MTTAEAVARHFVHLANQMEEPTPLTHMQVQKLVYYAQGWSLAYYKKPLFLEPIEAWQHGPVVDRVYQEFKKFGGEAIAAKVGTSATDLSSEETELLRWVWQRYSRYSGSYLRELTHRERPWKEAWGARPSDDRARVPISDAALSEFFREQAQKEAKNIGIDLDELEASIADAKAGRTAVLDLSSYAGNRGTARGKS
ncbi:MAG: SocA family protein [Phycisphaeraceae bacterium]|nr:SocA family protein [Phycisphaeraceae bacterium]